MLISAVTAIAVGWTLVDDRSDLGQLGIPRLAIGTTRDNGRSAARSIRLERGDAQGSGDSAHRELSSGSLQDTKGKVCFLGEPPRLT